MLRYHGELAAHAKDCARVVPGFAPESPEPVQLGLAFDGEAKSSSSGLGRYRSSSPSYWPEVWATS